MRFHKLWIHVSLAVIAAVVHGQDCLHYDDYIHTLRSHFTVASDDMEMRGNRLYVAGNHFGVYDTSNLLEPELLHSIYIRPDTLGVNIPSYRMRLTDDLAVIGASKSGGDWALPNEGVLQIVALNDPAEPQLLLSRVMPGAVDDALVVDSTLYVLCSLYYFYGPLLLQAYEFSDPTDPVLLNQQILDHPGGAEPLGLARHGNFLYVAGADLGVLDISSQLAPHWLETIPLAGDPYETVVVDNHLIVVGTEGLQIFDLAIPGSPALRSTLDLGTTAHRISVDGSTAYVLTGTGLNIIDISDFDHPTLVAFDPTLVGESIIGMGNLVYCAQGSNWPVESNGLHIEDVTGPGAAPYMERNVTPGPTGVLSIVGNLAFTASVNGLYCYDISDPKNIEQISYLPMDWVPDGIAVQNGYVYVVVGDQFYVADVENPAEPTILEIIDLPGYGGRNLAVVDGFALVANRSDGLVVIGITDPEHPQIVYTLPIDPGAADVAVCGTYAYVAGYSDGGLHVVDIANPSQPELVSEYLTPGNDVSIVCSGERVVLGSSNLVVFDVADKWNPLIVAEIPVGHLVTTMSALGNLVAVSCAGSIRLLDLDGSSLVPFLGRIPVIGTTWGIAFTESCILSTYRTNYIGGPSGFQASFYPCWPTNVPPEAPAYDAAMVKIDRVSPNPFNPITTIELSLESSETLEISAYDLAGKRVADLANRVFPAGTSTITWSGLDFFGRTLPSGAYVVRLVSKAGVDQKKVMLLR